MGYQLVRFVINLIMRLIVRLEVIDSDNVPPTGAYVAAANHLGRLDAVLPYFFTQRDDIIMIVAEKYRENIFLRWTVNQLDALYIDRFNADLSTLREVLNRLRKGGVLAMAPEGTRSPTGALIEAHSGGMYLAAKAGAPIVPVAIVGTEDRKVVANLKRLRRSHVVVRVGDPFILPPLPHKDRDRVMKEYTDEVMCQIAALLPPEYRGFYAGHERLKEILAGAPPLGAPYNVTRQEQFQVAFAQD
jgi:1-acyl-sn-glycerol-3-phosphate acyltransferase